MIDWFLTIFRWRWNTLKIARMLRFSLEIERGPLHQANLSPGSHGLSLSTWLHEDFACKLALSPFPACNRHHQEFLTTFRLTNTQPKLTHLPQLTPTQLNVHQIASTLTMALSILHPTNLPRPLFNVSSSKTVESHNRKTSSCVSVEKKELWGSDWHRWAVFNCQYPLFWANCNNS